jgi:hypothetical protein
MCFPIRKRLSDVDGLVNWTAWAPPRVLGRVGRLGSTPHLISILILYK